MARVNRAEHFWSFVKKDGDNACWLWAGARNHGGYGVYGFCGRQWRAHRLSYLWEHGVLPANMVVMHTCDTPACVNPAHLQLGTNQDNATDCCQKKRQHRPMGSGNNNGRLTLDIVADIRLSLEKDCDVAARLGLHTHTVQFIRTHKRWGHVSIVGEREAYEHRRKLWARGRAPSPRMVLKGRRGPDGD